MTGADLMGDAIAELYSADPDEFVQRRGALVARAREAGQAATARQIGALRKPTRSAWVVNQLVRSAPGVASDLSRLGEELAAAQRSLDGEAIRELSQRRRQLVEDLVRQALEVSGQKAPPAALRDEVAATLSAAVADPQVAEQLAAGTLERPAHREGFGPASPPQLSLVPPLPEDESTVPRRGKPAPGRASRRPSAPSPAREAELAGAERERRRHDALAEAERQAADAGRAADAATTAEQQQEAAVRQLEEQLAQARLRLADVRQQARRARARQRSAQQALGRLRR